MRLVRYFGSLAPGKMALWCYFIWYCVTLAFFFDPSPSLWLTSAGISLVIGIALHLSVSGAAGKDRRWQRFRLFLMPFCVSSFSALIKGKGYILIFPSRTTVLATSICACVAFVALVLLLKKMVRTTYPRATE